MSASSRRDKFRKALSQLPYVPRALSLVWTAAPRWTIAWIAILLIRGITPVALVFLTRGLVDTLSRGLGAGGSHWEVGRLTAWGAGLALVWLADEILDSLAECAATVQGERVSDHISGLLHTQALALDLSYFDEPDFYDSVHRARVDAASRPVALMQTLGNLARNSITLVAMAIVLAHFGLWLPIALALSTLPALVVALRYTLRFHEWRVRTTVDVRRAKYYDLLMTDRHSSAELRLLELGDHFKSAYQSLRTRLRLELETIKKGETISASLAAVAGVGVMAAGVAYMTAQARSGRISLGELALFLTAFCQGQRMMRSLLGSAGDFYRHLAFLENLFEFLALRPRIDDTRGDPTRDVRVRKEIRLQGVTFRYPGASKPALEDFSLTIPAGRIVAIVGENGAGKSTLLKLLCRFYDPESGEISIDGANVRELSPVAVRREITVLFQEPVRYSDSAARNIELGDLALDPVREAVETAARAAGADGLISRLAQGYDTMLGKWFGGAELSVGEWQRVALARAFWRRSSLIILDEPTSAMDSWAEADWMDRFRVLAAGRTVVLVTHRFTTALHADVIHVMQRGRVVQSGSHPELVAQEGAYAQSWRAQMREVLTC